MIDHNSSQNDIYDNLLSLDASKEAIINQSQVIKKIANSGESVIIGRCADYILKENENLIKIFIYAPMDYKIKNIIKNYGDNKKEAQEHILKSDKARATYYGVIANQVWGDKDNYDLCLNAKIGNENLVKFICDYIKTSNLK